MGDKWVTKVSKCDHLPIFHDETVKICAKRVFMVRNTMVISVFGTLSHIAHFGTPQGSNGGQMEDKGVKMRPSPYISWWNGGYLCKRGISGEGYNGDVRLWYMVRYFPLCFLWKLVSCCLIITKRQVTGISRVDIFCYVITRLKITVGYRIISDSNESPSDILSDQILKIIWSAVSDRYF